MMEIGSTHSHESVASFGMQNGVITKKLWPFYHLKVKNASYDGNIEGVIKVTGFYQIFDVVTHLGLNNDIVAHLSLNK
jgi:hypothetical protein